MKLKSNQPKASAEQVVKDIRRATAGPVHQRFSAAPPRYQNRAAHRVDPSGARPTNRWPH